jgi:hypothetical protein
MSTALSLLKVENEDNALLCIKIIIDGFRSHKVSLLQSRATRMLVLNVLLFRNKLSNTFSRF